MRPFTFRLFRFPVTVQPGFLLFVGLAALYGLQAQDSLFSILSWCGVLTGSLLVHELGHAVVARGLGVPVHGIDLAFMHGTTTHNRTTHQRQLLISLSGPAAGFGLAAVSLAVAAGLTAAGVHGPQLSRVLEQLLYVNIVYGVFNLLPILPLDGGHALRSALTWGTNARTALRVVGGIGVVCALGLVAFGIANGMMLLAALAGFLVWTNLQALQQAR